MNVHVFDSGVSDGRCKCGRKADDPVHVLHMADSPSAPPTTLPPFCGHEIWLPNCDTCLAGRGAEPLPAARPREEEATALLREADEWPFPGQADFLIQRLASALRESRARAEQIGKDRAIAWSEANGLTEHHYAVVEPELASLRARVEAAERDLADIRKICEEHGITDRIAGMECTVVGMVGKLAGLCSLRHEQREVTRRLLAEATSCIAQLEQSLALSEDKVKALRQQIEALPRALNDALGVMLAEKSRLPTSTHSHLCEMARLVNRIVRERLSSPTPTPTTANPAASLTQQGDPGNG